MRVGVAAPFGQNSVVVDLFSGGVFYVPPGQWFMNLGAQTIPQWFDPVQATWRNLASSGGAMIEGLCCDGYNVRLVNLSGVVQGGQITNAGSGGTNGIGQVATGVTIGFGAAPTNGIAAAAYAIVGGAINTTITITQAGSGFVVPPMLVLDPPPFGGIQATARCTIAAGAINAVTVDNAGAGYVTAPNVYVVPQYAQYVGAGVPVNPGGPPSIIPPGLIATQQPQFLDGINWPAAFPTTGGALLTVNPTLAGSGTLTGIVMTNYGANYLGTAIPTMSFSGGGLAGGVAATAIMALACQSITITAAGVAYTAGAAPFESTLGFLAAATGIINNNQVGARPIRGQAVIGTTTVSSTIIEDAGFGIQKVPSIGVIQQAGTAATTVANLTPVMGGVADTSLLQPAIW